jgi:hypothetical protein
MTAADELERMADELEKLEDAQDFGPMFERGVAEGLRCARVLLGERAAELRAVVDNGERSSLEVSEVARPTGVSLRALPPNGAWIPGAPWSHHGRRRTLSRVAGSMGREWVSCDETNETVDVAEVTEANGWRYLGPVSKGER